MANEYLNNRTFESIIQSFQYHKRQKAKYEMIMVDLKQTHERRVSKYKDEDKKAPLEENEQNHKDATVNYKGFQEQLAYAFYILSENIANYAKFNGIDIDDAIQEGVLICFEKIDRFDPRKGKAFNYMTTCILNHFRQLYRSARNYNELKKRYHGFLQEKLEGMIVNRRDKKYSQHDWKSDLN
jgi:DNA-directed RNA polymerase sigma subunit (sigma70/sigma32)